jgi:hypothetical protein
VEVKERINLLNSSQIPERAEKLLESLPDPVVRTVDSLFLTRRQKVLCSDDETKR